MRIRLEWIVVCAVLASASAGAERCGPVNCGSNEVCCNDGCGICVPRTGDGSCIALLCPWGAPEATVPGELPSADYYERRSFSLGYANQNISARASAQHYIAHGVAAHIRVDAAPENFNGEVGVTWGLPISRLTVAPLAQAHASLNAGGGEVGAALMTRFSLVNVYAHALFEEFFGVFEGTAFAPDLGIGASVKKPYLLPTQGGTAPLPLELSVAYRYRANGHRAVGGLYWLNGKFHLGVEAEWSPDPDAPFAAFLRVDYYGEAND